MYCDKFLLVFLFDKFLIESFNKEFLLFAIEILLLEISFGKKLLFDLLFWFCCLFEKFIAKLLT